MPDAFILNQQPTTYGASVSMIVEMLVAAGWTYKASGDGLSAYSATGKVFTGTGSGAGGWNNNRAWARLAAPDGIREICVQHNANQGVRLKTSTSAKFVGGSPGAVTVPGATDERVLWGAGTDGTPTLTTWFSTGTLTGSVKWQGYASSAAPYGFWVAGATTPAGAMTNGLMLDPVQSVPEDPDPVVWHIGTSTGFNRGGLGSTSIHSSTSYPASGGSQAGSWGHMDTAVSVFGYVMPSIYSAGEMSMGLQTGSLTYATGPSNHVVNPFNGKHEMLPVMWFRPANVASLGNPGIKGWSKFMRWTTVPRTNFVDTLDNKRWICVGLVWLPWDGITAPSN